MARLSETIEADEAPKNAHRRFHPRRRPPRRVQVRARGQGIEPRVRRATSGRISKIWVQRVRIAGRSSIGFGPYPEVTFSEAWEKAIENSRAILRGRDPRDPVAPTFAKAAERTIRMHREARGRPKARSRRIGHPRSGRTLLRSSTCRWIGSRATMYWNALRPSGARGRPPPEKPVAGSPPSSTGALVRATARTTRWSVRWRLPRVKSGRTRHHRALPHAEVRLALRVIRRMAETYPIAALCVEMSYSLLFGPQRRAVRDGRKWISNRH